MERRGIFGALGAAALLTLPSRGIAQPGAGRGVRIVVPFGPGGSGDITARMFAEFLTRRTGSSVVVENKPGASGVVGVEAAKRSPNDGSVLLLATTSTHLANPSLFRNLPYDPERDFTLVGHFGGGSMLVLVRPQSAYRSLGDLVAAAKAAPDKLNYGHFNASSNIPGAMLGRVAGIRLTPIPYKAIANAMTDLMSGEIDVIFVDSVAGDSFAQSGQLRAIAAAGPRRLPKYPSVPLITELYPAYDVSAGMLGIAVPAGAPPALLQSLNDLCNEAVSTDPMKTALLNFGFHPRPMSLAELAAYVTRERAMWREQVAVAKIEPQ
jgi:tripartite-type tricarboxylate transporter receptor subunit TctC